MVKRAGSWSVAIACCCICFAAAWFYSRNQPVQTVQPISAETGEIVVGVNAELSGKHQQNGQSALNGVKMAAAEINASGGLIGKPIRVVWVDNKSEEIEVVRAVGELAEENKLSAMIGPNLSNLAILSAQQADQRKIPCIAIAATNPRVTVDDSGRTRPYMFRVCYIDSLQGRVMARFAAETLHARSAAIFIDDSAVYSQGLASFFENSFLQEGGTISGKAGYSPGADNYQRALARLLQGEPDVLFIPGYYREVAPIIIQAREMGFQGPIVGGDSWVLNFLTQRIPVRFLNDLYYCDHFGPPESDPRTATFVAKYRQFAQAEVMTNNAALAYDAMMMLADAIRRCGSADPDKIRDALEQTKDFSALAGTISLDRQHNPLKAVVVVAIRNGRGVFYQRVSQ